MEVVAVTLPTEIRRRRNELVLRVQRAEGAVAVFSEASRRLRRLVPFDAAVWLTTDPGTGLPTAPTLAEDLDLDGGREQCAALWRREFLVADVNLYRDLARAEVPAASLRASGADSPAIDWQFTVGDRVKLRLVNEMDSDHVTRDPGAA